MEKEEEEDVEGESDYEETDSELSDNEDNQQPSWSEDQIELLESALTSYQFLPRTTTEKVYAELKEGIYSSCGSITRGMVRSWFSSKEMMARSARDRWEARLKKLAVCDHAEGSSAKTERKIRFSEEVAVENVEENLETSVDSIDNVNSSPS